MSQKQTSISLSTGLPVFALIITVLITTPMPVYAQGVLEEVVVTARKREESLQDVPISVQAHTGAFLAEQNIIDIQQLAPYTPNFQYATAAGASDLYIMRGLGTIGSGIHFEPSVGQQFNGFFSTRSRMGRAAFLDVAQVEVLKGPQGAVIGKNTSLGAINITSNQPTEEFEAKLSTQYNFEASEGFEVEGVVSGPVTDRLRGRVAVNYRDTDGWNKNTVLNIKTQEKEDLSARVMFDYDFTDDITAQFMYQRTDFDRNGKGRIVMNCVNPAVATAPPLLQECRLSDKSSAVNLRNGVDVGEPFTLENDFYGVTVNWDMGDFQITSLTSFFEYEITDSFSSDQTRLEINSINNAEFYEQFMQEVRLASTFADAVDYTLGAMYFKGDMDTFQQFHSLGMGGPGARNEIAGSETNSWAVFGQADWRIHDRLTLTLGGRYTDERRTGSKAQIIGPVYAGVEASNAALCGAMGFFVCTRGNDNLQPNGTPVTGKISKDNFSINTALSYEIFDNSMLYVAYATGFKSGGFDLRGAADPSTFIFPQEETTNIEIGGKHTFFNNSLRLNWTGFYTEVDDLQISSNDTLLTQQIVGKADVTSMGVEWDVLWAATDALTLSLTGSWMDAEYDSFIGACYSTQTAAQGCTLAGPAQDLSNQDTAYAPEWSFVAGAEYVWVLPDNMELKTSTKYIFIDDLFVLEDHDPTGQQGASQRIDASLVLSGTLGSGNPWTLGVIGKNLTNKLVFQFSNRSGSSGQLSTNSFIEETRYIALRGTIGW